MGLASKLLRGMTKRTVTKAMDKVGGRLVSRIADTSADAPSAFHQPKRDVYRHMKDDGPVRAPASDADQGQAEPSEHGHHHDHDHD